MKETWSILSLEHLLQIHIVKILKKKGEKKNLLKKSEKYISEIE